MVVWVPGKWSRVEGVTVRRERRKFAPSAVKMDFVKRGPTRERVVF